jgi:hypothetical protein
MVQLLQKFAQTKQHLRLRVPNRDDDYTTVIIDCDWPSRILLLDHAISPGGPVSLQNYELVQLDGTLTGVHYTLHGIPLLDNPLLDKDSNAQEGQLAGFPSLISYQQRRQSFRTTIPRSLSSNLEIKIEDSDSSWEGLVLEGRLLDLSASGLACECLIAAEAGEKKFSQLKLKPISISIDLDELMTIACTGQIKEILPSSRDDVLRLGIEFSDLCPSLQRLVDKAVVDVQRLTRKNQTR